MKIRRFSACRKQEFSSKMKSTKNKEAISKDMTLAEAVGRYPKTIPVFMKYGMHCMGCPMAMQETIEQGAEVHGIDLKKMLKDLNEAAGKK